MLKRSPIERHFPWRELRDVSRRQGTRKPPIYSVHRWWARRPPELYRTILRYLATNGGDGAKPLEGRVVLDPFMGGGTTLVEAQRLGADVIGCDTEDLACRITALELSSPPHDAVWDAIEQVLRKVERQLARYYPSRGPWVVLHYFWVDSVACAACGRQFEAHPASLLGRDRKTGIQTACCLYCSRIQELEARNSQLECTCARSCQLDASNARAGKYRCPWCGHEERITEYVRRTGARAGRVLIAKEEVNLESGQRRYRSVHEQDHQAFIRAYRHFRRVEARLPIPRTRVVVIRGDARPRSYGFARYRDMFNARQLLHHGSVLKAVAGLSEPARSIALVAFSQSLETNCMFCLYATDWRRIAGLFSIHGYMYVTRPVELNPWLQGVGRGTLRNCVMRIRRAFEWKAAESDATTPGRRTLYVGSLERLPSSQERVDFIVTDPPYFDNLNYAYLARFHSAWLKCVPRGRQRIRRVGGEAVVIAASRSTSVAWGGFRDRLLPVFSRCRSLLKREGFLVFTFAHRLPAAWRGLSEAIRRAGFRVVAVYAVECEGNNGFHKSEGNLRWNALFVCKRGRAAKGNVRSIELRRAMRIRRMSESDRASLRLALRMAKACR